MKHRDDDPQFEVSINLSLVLVVMVMIVAICAAADACQSAHRRDLLLHCFDATHDLDACKKAYP